MNVSFSGINLSLAPDLESASAARQSLGNLKGSVSSEKLEDLRLVVTELVTNSVRHADLASEDEISLEIQVAPGVIRGSVSDPGTGFQPREVRPDHLLCGMESSGWGLYVVGRVSENWGVECGPRTRVWFEIEDSAAKAAGL